MVDRGIYGEDIPNPGKIVRPGFNLLGAARILGACDFDARLYLAEGDGREMKRAIAGQHPALHLLIHDRLREGDRPPTARSIRK